MSRDQHAAERLIKRWRERDGADRTTSPELLSAADREPQRPFNHQVSTSAWERFVLTLAQLLREENVKITVLR